jgi:hypothetical protein
MCKRKYRDNVSNNIDQNTSRYCGIKLSLDMPGPHSKHRHLKTITAVNGEKAYHFLKYNGNVEQGNTASRTLLETRADESGEHVQAVEQTTNLQLVQQMKRRPFLNQNMIRQDPYDVLKYLIENDTMPPDIVPRFILWENEYRSDSVSEITENTTARYTNPLLLLGENDEANQVLREITEEQRRGQEQKTTGRWSQNKEDDGGQYQDTTARYTNPLLPLGENDKANQALREIMEEQRRGQEQKTTGQSQNEGDDGGQYEDKHRKPKRRLSSFSK